MLKIQEYQKVIDSECQRKSKIKNKGYGQARGLSVNRNSKSQKEPYVKDRDIYLVFYGGNG